MNSNMVKPEKFDHLHLVYHFTISLRKVSFSCGKHFSPIYQKNLCINFLCTYIEKGKRLLSYTLLCCSLTHIPTHTCRRHFFNFHIASMKDSRTSTMSVFGVTVSSTAFLEMWCVARFSTMCTILKT